MNLKKRLQKVNYRFLFVTLVALTLIYLSEPKFPYTANGIFYLPYFIIGLCLIIVGEIIRIWATGHLEKNKNLTTSGPYGYIKNPMYAGSFIILMGFNSLAINPYIHYILLVELVAFILVYIPTKRKIESTRLLEKFGSEYADYDKNVPDYIPRRLIAYPVGERRIEKRWRWQVFWENQEIQVAFAVLVGVIAIYL
ncbi:MAG: isoprenylcysteine carboxylmethyltransferase family protein [Planctomycetota bacterium]|nr:isoprenylcysteine carboxylmethyltransferase family protein [Planctomycetota bacterium]MDI6787095.1 isoprenylcysteine carboxylmethyltransferase family protein [Planctomycetota bacterium]